MTGGPGRTSSADMAQVKGVLHPPPGPCRHLLLEVIDKRSTLNRCDEPFVETIS